MVDLVTQQNIIVKLRERVSKGKTYRSFIQRLLKGQMQRKISKMKSEQAGGQHMADLR